MEVKYKVDNSGHTIMVPRKNLYDLRMTFAKLGLPKSGTIGYEIFDQTNLGVTDYVQKINYKRALEGEIVRSIESLEEVRKCRVHIVIPKESVSSKEIKCTNELHTPRATNSIFKGSYGRPSPSSPLTLTEFTPTDAPVIVPRDSISSKRLTTPS